jgi:hypothetical protein
MPRNPDRHGIPDRMDQSSNAVAPESVSDRDFDVAQMSVSFFISSLGSDSARPPIGRNLIEAQPAHKLDRRITSELVVVSVC